jgi:hypothetical protein
MSIIFFIKDAADVIARDGINQVDEITNAVKDTILNDGSVRYAGKTLPRDAKKPVQTTGDTDPSPEQVNYNGKELPRDKVTFIPQAKDLTNNPSLVIIGGITLPPDTAIYVSGKKVLATSKILDGVSVVERILREPYEIEFECVVRAQQAGDYIFPQDALDNIWSNVWLPDTVQKIQNTYLNKLGMQEIIIESVSPTTVRGSKNIPLRIRAYENVAGQTLLVT